MIYICSLVFLVELTLPVLMENYPFFPWGSWTRLQLAALFIFLQCSNVHVLGFATIDNSATVVSGLLLTFRDGNVSIEED